MTGLTGFACRNLDQLDVLHAEARELRGQRLSGAAHVGAVLRQGGDRRYPEQGFQLVKKLQLVLLGKCNSFRVHKPSQFVVLAQ
jgi:hypothetical protein